MNSFTVVLFLSIVGLAFGQYFDGRRGSQPSLDNLRDMFGKDADEFFKRFDRQNPRPFPRRQRPSGRNQLPTSPRPGGKPSPSVPQGNLLNKQTDCKCRMGTSNRIVNGQVAAKNSIPWQVSLASHSQHFCGASIINSLYILTAAHCIEGKSARSVQVRVGLHNLKDANQDNTYVVEEIISHPYTTPSKPGDIAILKLAKPIKFIPGKVEPGCINLAEKDYPNDLIVSGWGTTSISRKVSGKLITGDISPVLKRATLHQEKDRCEDYLVCVDSHNGDSVCQGDSGGPLNYVENGRSSIQGVASFVTGEVKRGNGGTIELCTGRGAYSKNAYYKEWFKNIIQDNHCSL